ncbi:MAG: sugar phosphate isomerase/epimerase family protein [Candidatus Binatia bacterium]
MRRAIVTDEVAQDPAEAIRLARRFGLAALEIRSVWEKRPHELTGSDIRALRGMARDADLAVCAVATPVFKCALDDRRQGREHLEILKRCLDVCRELEAPLARVFTFWRPGAPGAPDTAVRPPAWRDVAPTIADRLGEAADIARDFGCRLAIENEPSVYGSACAHVAELIVRLNHPAIGALWDPGNALYDPAAEPPYPDGYGALRPYIVHVHVKDTRRDLITKAAEAVALGDGEIPYPAIFRRLRDDRYAGFASLETHYRIGPALSDEAARMPSGSIFSAGGLEASIICLERWDAMMAAIDVPAVGA